VIPQSRSVVLACFFLSLIACQSVTYEPQADRQGIKEVVGTHFHEVENCYLKAIEDRPGASGKVLVSWDIEPDGHVSKARVISAGAKIAGIGDCLITAITAWTFPRLSKEELTVTVNYPFYFSENGSYKDE